MVKGLEDQKYLCEIQLCRVSKPLSTIINDNCTSGTAMDGIPRNDKKD
jgi:hypothetical protein